MSELKRKIETILSRFIVQLAEPSSRSYIAVLLFIICTGTFLRLYGAMVGHGYHAFAINDELSAYEYALRYLAGDQQAQYLGQPFFRGGQVPGPFWTLFWVGLYKLGGESVPNAIIWMSFFNAIAIVLIFQLARQFFNAKYTLFTTLLFAVAPWSVYYSTGMWNPMPLVVIGAALFLLLLDVTRQNESRNIFWVCIIAAIIPQFHMNGIFYYPAILLLLYVMPTTINRKWFAYGVVAGILLYLPYVVGEALNNWDNTKHILIGEQNKKGFSFSVVKIFSAPATVLSSAPGRWAGETTAELKHFGNAWFGHFSVLLAFAAVSLITGLMVFIKFLWDGFLLIKNNQYSLQKAYNNNPQLLFLFILVALPLLLFLPTGHNYATRYTILILTLLFVLPGLFVFQLRNIRLRKIFITQYFVMVIFNVYLSVAFFNYQDNMMVRSDKFIASFSMLEYLREKIVNDAGPHAKINIILDEPVNKLPEINRKTIHALVEYIETHQQYVDIKMNSKLEKRYLITLPGKISHRNIIHRGNGLVITRRD